jgi:hypothetical protein
MLSTINTPAHTRITAARIVSCTASRPLSNCVFEPLLCGCLCGSRQPCSNTMLGTLQLTPAVLHAALLHLCNPRSTSHTNYYTKVIHSNTNIIISVTTAAIIVAAATAHLPGPHPRPSLHPNSSRHHHRHRHRHQDCQTLPCRHRLPLALLPP